MFASLNTLCVRVCASLCEFVFFPVCCLCAHSVIRLNVSVYTFLMYARDCVCVCIYSIIGCECVPAHTDDMLINVCEETACEIQGGQR